jgi:hypothetical protein
MKNHNIIILSVLSVFVLIALYPFRYNIYTRLFWQVVYLLIYTIPILILILMISYKQLVDRIFGLFLFIYSSYFFYILTKNYSKWISWIDRGDSSKDLGLRNFELFMHKNLYFGAIIPLYLIILFILYKNLVVQKKLNL